MPFRKHIREGQETSQIGNPRQIGLMNNFYQEKQIDMESTELSKFSIPNNKNSEIEEIFGEFFKTNDEEYDPNYPNDYTKVN